MTNIQKDSLPSKTSRGKDYEKALKSRLEAIRTRKNEIKNNLGGRQDYGRLAVEIAKTDYGLNITRSCVYSTVAGTIRTPSPKVLIAIEKALDVIEKEYEALLL